MATDTADEGSPASTAAPAEPVAEGSTPASTPAADASALAEKAFTAAVAADPNLETVTLTLSKDAIDFLRSEAEHRKTTAGEIVRLAIGTQKFLTERMASGWKVQLKGTGGTTLDVNI